MNVQALSFNQSRVQCVDPHELTEAHLSEWRSFQSSNPALASPFLTPEFQLLVSELRPNVEVAVFEENGRIAGFLPFERQGRIGKPVGGALSDCQAVIAAPWWNWNPIDLVRGIGLSVYDFTHHRGEQAQLKPFHCVLERSHTIELERGFAAYVEECRLRGSGNMSGAPHTTLARKRRLERQLGPVRFEMYDFEPCSLRQLIAWKSLQYNRARHPSDAFARPWTVSLLERIHATRTRTFAGVLSTLSAGDTLLAAHMGMRSESVLHWWFPAYDPNPSYLKFSPGLILLLELCRAANEFGIRTIELGPGDEPYKLLVANGQIDVGAGFVGCTSIPLSCRRLLHRALDTVIYLGSDPTVLWLGRLLGRLESRSRYDDFNTCLFALAQKANALACTRAAANRDQ